MQTKSTFQDILNVKSNPLEAKDSSTNIEFLQNEHTKIALIKYSSAQQFNVWIEHNREKVEQVFRQHGAVLFRNLNTLSPSELQEVAGKMSKKLISYTEASTPRLRVSGNIYTSTEYPNDQSIPLHNEHSYTREFPRRIWFFCHTLASKGGETPIADSRSVYKKIDPQIIDLFTRKNIRYVRNYSKDLDIPWQTVFDTQDKSVVEKYCKERNISFKWMDNDGLRTSQIIPAVIEHPERREMVWFNQAHLFHHSSLESSVSEFLINKYGIENLPRNAYLGDGTEINAEVLSNIREAFKSSQLVFPWQQNDLLMLDNIQFAHGRNPFERPRLVYVAMADPTSFDEIDDGTRTLQKAIDETRIKTASYFVSDRSLKITDSEIKYTLCAVFRMLAMEGLDDGISGHITVKVPDEEGTYWTNPLGFMFEEMTPDHLIKINSKGEILEGKYPVNVAGFAIHSSIHAARKDAQCLIHTHSPWGTVFSALNKPIIPLDQNSCMFYENYAHYEEFHGAVNESKEATRLKKALGDANVLILKNHGTITCGESFEHATMLMIHVEKAYRMNFYSLLAGDYDPISPEVARETRDWVANPVGFKIEFDALMRKVERKYPDLLNFKPLS